MDKHTVVQRFDMDNLEIIPPRLYNFGLVTEAAQLEWLYDKVASKHNLRRVSFTVYDSANLPEARDTWRFNHSSSAWEKEDLYQQEAGPIASTPGPHRVGFGPGAGGRFINAREKGEQHFSVFDSTSGCLAHVFKEGDAILYAHATEMRDLLRMIGDGVAGHLAHQPIDWGLVQDEVIKLFSKLPEGK